MVYAQHKVILGPSDALKQGASLVSWDHIFRPLPDLRNIYCDLETIKRREQNGVFLLDTRFELSTNEVKIGTNDTLRKLLNFTRYTNWNGGRQIRLIKRNQIIQSTYMRSIGTTNWAQFLEQKIEPGDIVVFCLLD